MFYEGSKDFHIKFLFIVIKPIANRAKAAKDRTSLWQMSIFENCNKIQKKRFKKKIIALLRHNWPLKNEKKNLTAPVSLNTC
jgi:hypothetical protein